MNTNIIKINENKYENQNCQRMTSLEIAELTGKQHKNVMQAIRNMEPAWEKVTGLKFQLCEKNYLLANGVVKKQPFYQLTKTECLYIATKFNDEARAKLVLRWQELEKALPQPLRGGENFLPSPRDVLKIADKIIGTALSKINEAAEDTLTATQVAKTFNMKVRDFNAVLEDMGIQYRRGGHWNLVDTLQDRGYTEMRLHISYSLRGKRKVKQYMTWTLAGVRYLNSKLGYPNF